MIGTRLAQYECGINKRSQRIDVAMTDEARATLKKQIEDTLQAAKTLRDEIRVELHLASLDAKEQWEKLEPQLADVEKLGSEVSLATRLAAAQLKSSFHEFREALKRHRQSCSNPC